MNIITSSSSSSSTTDTLELNVSDTGMGCIPGIMRRILCRNTARQAVREAKQVSRELYNETEEIKPAPSPGLVARLMGLDSMPVFPYTPPSSMARSRSTSSLESWPSLFLSGERCSSSESLKMRTSVSFREAPTFLRKENEDFLLLTFTSEPSEEKAKKELKLVREMKKEKAANRREDKKDKHNKQRTRRRNSVRTVKKEREVELDFSSQNSSSPNSVLDNAFGIDDKYHGEKEQEEKRRSSRKKLSSELDCLQCSTTPRIKFNVVVDDGGLRSQRNNRMREHEKPGHGSPELWELIFMFADEDLKRSNWFSTEKCKSEEAEEIAFITALHILDFLLLEVVNDLYLN